MIEELIGLIPAAGKGLRLGLPYPKELYPIIRDNRYKPVSQFVLENLTASGIENIIFVINESKHQLIGYFGNGQRFDSHISFVVQEPNDTNNISSSPGLADALNSAYHLLRGKTVCFGMADTIMTPNDVFRQVLNQSDMSEDVMLGLFPTYHPEKFGMVDLSDDGKIVQIVDKPQHTDLVFMWGLIIWRPKFTDHLNTSISLGINDFARILNMGIQQGLHYRGIVISNGSYIDLGTYDEIQELERLHRAL